ncbi:MAG TPA: hypothetical protein VMZ51_08125 [Acidimicrobiales bacterium]|nr:hypothetical protein [Acidimicrobiales bacterium]
MRTAAEAIAVLDRLVGTGEQPDGSNNAPPITTWWGLQGPWCNMTESYAWAQSGWSKDGGRTLDMPGVAQQKPGKGWARVDLMVQAFKSAGRYGTTPKVGAAFHIGAGDGAHTGLVARVNANATIDTLEGNYQNRLARVTRAVSSIRGYCYPAYEPGASPTPTPPTQEDPMAAAYLVCRRDGRWYLTNLIDPPRYITSTGVLAMLQRNGVPLLNKDTIPGKPAGTVEDDVWKQLSGETA